MNRLFFFLMLVTAFSTLHAQSEADEFWDRIESLCGKSFEGVLELPVNDAQFGGKQLKMHIRSCDSLVIRIPFVVGEDLSRTWVLTKADDRISLAHDHRHSDGSSDAITMYGGTASNAGQSKVQIFPADGWTKELIPAAASNVWWITIDEQKFSYNLRRLGTDRVFRVVFDLTKEVTPPPAPWGWKNNH